VMTYLFVVLLAYCYWFQAKWSIVIVLLTFVASVFRCEIILLLGSLVLQGLLSRKLRFWDGVTIGLLTALCSIGITFTISLTIHRSSVTFYDISLSHFNIFFFLWCKKRSQCWLIHIFGVICYGLKEKCFISIPFSTKAKNGEYLLMIRHFFVFLQVITKSTFSFILNLNSFILLLFIGIFWLRFPKSFCAI
jgi:hypothetical protein